MSLKNLLVKDFISEALIVNPSTPLSRAIGLMEENSAYEVFISIGDKVGIVTVRDMLRAKGFTDTRIEAFMSFVPKLSLDADLIYAAKIMAEYRLRALPVTRNNEVIGKLDVKAIISKVRDSGLSGIRISKIMSSPPLTISYEDKVAKAREIMLRKKFDQLPVVKDKKIEGVVTSTQIVFNLIPRLGGGRYTVGVPDTIKYLDSPVNTIMDTDPLKCSPQDTVRKAVEDMFSRNSSYCLVTLGEELQGIVTYRDFIKLISEGDKAGIPVHMIGLPDDPFEAEAAKVKFTRIVSRLSRILPSITEARSVIKTADTGGLRRRYDVDVTIKSPGENYNFSLTGWDLPVIYDELADIIKKAITSKKRRGRSIRYSE